MDPDISRWILEFLLHQPTVTTSTLTALLPSLLHLQNHEQNLHFKKALLLKGLEHEINTKSISMSVLTLLEQLEEIDFRLLGHQTTASFSMKHAYAAVAAKLTLQVFGVGTDGWVVDEFKDTVCCLWKGRIGRMLEEGGGLGSKELSDWKEDMEVSLWDYGTHRGLVERFRLVNAVEAVESYLSEEKGKMRRPFLEVVAERVKNDVVLANSLGVEDDHVDGGEEAHLPTSSEVKGKLRRPFLEVVAERVKNDVVFAKSLGVEDDHVDGGEEAHLPTSSNVKKVHRVRVWGKRCRGPRGAKLADATEELDEPSRRNDSILDSPEFNKVREALELSEVELGAVVKDPLPNALRVAKTSDIRKNGRDEVLVVDKVGFVQASQGNANNMPRSSSMAQINGARTYEREGSADGSQESSSNHVASVELHSPRKMHVSPVGKKRRETRPWSPTEEDTLRKGVEKYEKGNWAVILDVYKDKFQNRTAVDLKDKWRNMTTEPRSKRLSMVPF